TPRAALVSLAGSVALRPAAPTRLTSSKESVFWRTKPAFGASKPRERTGGSGFGENQARMNGVDLIILVAVAASAAHGFFRGAAVQLLSFGGFWFVFVVGAVRALMCVS